MAYQIDQSIKIEDTQKSSYVCLANGSVVIASIAAKEKRILKLYFRKLQKPLIFKIFTFSVLCAQVLMKTRPRIVYIDKEYTAHERQIKSFITQIFSIHDVEIPIIHFDYIEKNVAAHKEAYEAMKNKYANLRVCSKEVLRYYEKINKK